MKKLLVLCTLFVLVFSGELGIAKESSNAKNSTTSQSAKAKKPDFIPYRPISKNPRNDGLYVGFYYVAHGKTYQGKERKISKKSEYYESTMLADAIGVGYYTSFLDKVLRQWDETQGMFGIDWAGDLIDIDKVPFYIYLFWNSATQMLLDKEQKSLCYTGGAWGCVFPYTPHIKDSKAYRLPNLDSGVLYEINSKRDIVFPIALTSNKEFYQVIIFPSFMELKGFESLEKSYEFIESTRNDCGDMVSTAQCREPINAFVPKSAIKKVLPNHPLMRLDPKYADSPVFFTPPETIHRLNIE